MPPCHPSSSFSEPTPAALFAATAARHPRRVFLHVLEATARAYDIPAGPLTYADATAEIAALRARYARAGYGPGHRVGLMLENRPDFFLHWFALNGLGAGVVPLSAELRSAECDYLIAHSGIVLAVAAPAHRDRLAASFTLTITPGEAPPPAPTAAPFVHDECALLYTSGTTGPPKGCVLSNDYFLRIAAWYASLDALAALRDGDRLLTPLPLTHMNAMAYSAMAMIATGGTLIQLDRFHPATWWDDVRHSGATIVHYLGVMPAMLLAAPPDPRDRAQGIRFGFGAGVDPAQHAAFEARFGFPLLEAWAMTETGAGAVVIADRKPRGVGTGCFGRPASSVQTRIVDESDEPAESGELLVRAAGPDPRAGFFSAYLHDPVATETAWADGWFHTGDLVRADATGVLYFVDRKKNLIRRSGENIGAVEVEIALRRHHAVADVAVAAAPDPLRGEEVLACIVAKAPVGPDAQAALAGDIFSHALAELSYFKTPGWIAFVDALPLTASRKIARGELKALAAHLLAEGACHDLRPRKRRPRP